MAEYLIQSETLDDIADAINAKTGGSSAMTPAEIVTAIGSISSGGGDKLIAYATGEDIGNLYYPEVTGAIIQNAFCGCKAEVAFFPKATADNGSFTNLPNLKTAVINSLSNYTQFGNCSQLKVFDGINITDHFHYTFSQSPKVDTLILRRADAITPLQSTNTLSATCFKSGGTGGTIYIPKSLYDHLGDGTSLDYKAATNWSTFDGYGTIAWAQIEGSIYETQYADGTPITTA